MLCRGKTMDDTAQNPIVKEYHVLQIFDFIPISLSISTLYISYL